LKKSSNQIRNNIKSVQIQVWLNKVETTLKQNQ
jgi:hypothetical protein